MVWYSFFFDLLLKLTGVEGRQRTPAPKITDAEKTGEGRRKRWHNRQNEELNTPYLDAK